MVTNHLPHETDCRYITDAGLETDMIFRRGIELPEFAAFPLLDSEAGRAALEAYYGDYSRIAQASGSCLLLESPTWRASPDWGARLGYSIADLDRVNRLAISLLHNFREHTEVAGTLVSGTVGPRYDGYSSNEDSREESARYHQPQFASFSIAGADLATAYTITHVGEAAGIVDAARAVDLPIAISFTVETDGRLPSGMTLAEAISELDRIAAPNYFLINCAHPTHIEKALNIAGPWRDRILGTRANASIRSHEELNDATDLDDGDPVEFADAQRRVTSLLPNLTIFGGCCGTDARHVAALVDLPDSAWVRH